jgi:hypothetical protein
MKSRKNIKKYTYLKILATKSREIHDNLISIGRPISIKKCRKYTHELIKNEYKIISK